MTSKRSILEAKAWRLMSRCIRLEAANNQGVVECYTCGARKHWKQTDAGHWQSRANKPTKFWLENIRPQCKQCNKWGHPTQERKAGEPKEFERRLTLEGVDTEFIKERAKRGPTPTIPDLEDLIEELHSKLTLVVASAFGRGVADARDALK